MVNSRVCIFSSPFCRFRISIFESKYDRKFCATVAFYGANPKPLEAVAKITGPVLGIYAGEDDWINSGLPAIVESMIKYKKTFEMKLYSGVQHAFFNETMPTYNKSAAEDAWERAVSFFSKYLVK